MPRNLLVGFTIAIFSILLSSCEVNGKHQIKLNDTSQFGFSKSRIVELGRLILIDYDLFNSDATNANPAYPTASSFPLYKDLLENFTPLANLQGKDSVNSPTKEFYGHIWRSNDDPKTLIISIRGTSDTQEWIDDAKFLLVPFSNNPEHGKVELGFNEIFTSFTLETPDSSGVITLSDYLKNLSDINTVIVAGHSLGSSMATLVAFSATQLAPEVSVKGLTFASPLTGDPNFANAYELSIIDSIRIVNHPDLVPRMPFPAMGYEHIWHEVEINSLERLDIVDSIACYHSLNTYLHILDSSVELQASCQKKLR